MQTISSANPKADAAKCRTDTCACSHSARESSSVLLAVETCKVGDRAHGRHAESICIYVCRGPLGTGLADIGMLYSCVYLLALGLSDGYLEHQNSTIWSFWTAVLTGSSFHEGRYRSRRAFVQSSMTFPLITLR